MISLDGLVMLAGNVPKDLGSLNYPVLASPKLDGIRCTIRNGVALSRNLIPLPNKQVQLFGDSDFNGFDGELIVGDPCTHGVYNRTQSIVMSENGTSPDLQFYVFDDTNNGDKIFLDRLTRLQTRISKCRNLIQFVEHQWCHNPNELKDLDDYYVSEGYEGTMIRDPAGPYKHGRSTTKQGWLLKLKRFEYGEAKIVGFRELTHNDNQERKGGAANRRSTKKENMIGRKVLGSFIVRDLKTALTFSVGTGFSASDRSLFWKRSSTLVGTILRYKYVPYGVKTLPRNPVFAGFRSKIDL
jgi:DNA ligase 1